MLVKFARGELRPYVFHMCWTESKVQKLQYLKNMALWFLDPKCPLAKESSVDELAGLASVDCCLADATAWRVPTPYATKLDFRSRFNK